MEEDYNVCLECGHEWEENNAYMCPRCLCGDICVYKEEDINGRAIANETIK